MNVNLDPLEAKSKEIYRDYLITKYPNLCQDYFNSNSLLCNLSSFKLTNGQSNEIYFCQLINQCDVIGENDAKVVIRFFGSQLTGSGNAYKMNDVKEKEIHDKVSKTLKLPEILHTFARGRIERFFELRSINLGEFERYSCEIAEIISRIHSLDMSDIIQKNQNHLRTVLSNLYRGYLDNVSSFARLRWRDKKTEEKFRQLSIFDFKKMIDWVLEMNEKINPKMIFSHNDVNRSLKYCTIFGIQRMNHLRTNFHWLKNSTQSELIIIDFEYANYGYRWADLSNYLVELTVEKASGREQQVENYFPSEKFCLKFLSVYLECLKKKNNGHEFEKFEDNLKILSDEVDFGCIVINLIRLIWILGLSHNKLNEFNFWEDAHLRFMLMQKMYQKFCIAHSELL